MLLHLLSDDQIISSVHRLTRHERTTTVLVLLHLSEIERRELHLSLGYSSMFAFCTRCLGYSESDAGRRIAAARCVRRFPEAYAMLESNTITVATLSRVASLLTEENRSDILARIQGRTQDEVEAIVAELRPRAAEPRDRVEVIVRRPVAQPPTAPLLTPASGPGMASSHAAGPVASERACEMKSNSHDESECKDSSRAQDERHVNAIALSESLPPVRCVRVSFAASEEFNAKVQRVRVLAAHRLPRRASLEDVFALLMDDFLEREDPAKRLKRRAQRAPEKQSAAPTAGAASVNARYIPAAMRDEIFQRDHGRCTYVGKDGRRCGSTHMLQVDHIHAVALGGTGTPGNLRLLCAHHNRFVAERLLGKRVARKGQA